MPKSVTYWYFLKLDTKYVHREKYMVLRLQMFV
jgi:hypothetical protein